MMIEVAIAAVLVAIHTPVLREVQRHEALKIDAQFQRQGAAVARENHIYALNTVSTLYGLADTRHRARHGVLAEIKEFCNEVSGRMFSVLEV